MHHESKCTKGPPRIHREFAVQGHLHARKPVARLLHQVGLAGKAPRRWRTTHYPRPGSQSRRI
ncbi:transposase [Lentzea atacamensis]|uniref:transposase n=1 Tax=Lentzea atacamensis TaxID=531938 RepID=UPI0014761E6C|nr:transposase [Lentzea atacamensis]